LCRLRLNSAQFSMSFADTLDQLTAALKAMRLCFRTISSSEMERDFYALQNSMTHSVMQRLRLEPALALLHLAALNRLIEQLSVGSFKDELISIVIKNTSRPL
jgi:hypothetical protein